MSSLQVEGLTIADGRAPAAARGAPIVVEAYLGPKAAARLAATS